MTAGLPDRAADREREWCPECAGHRTVRVISATHAIFVACPACTGGPLAAAALTPASEEKR
ncbi:MAG TPA: hypothetical protein VFH56_02235 [Acidimicrobiales bacterium]|nr:hypothetical protein [Acidimicrobiales bacterium]